MRINQLWAAAGVLLFAFTLSCTTSDQKKDEQKKDDTLQSKEEESQKSGVADSVSEFEADSITDRLIMRKMHNFSIKKDSTVTFCGKLNNPNDKIRLRFTIYYSKKNKSLKKVTMIKLRGDDRFQFQFTAPANGEMHLVIEEEKKVTWKNLKLSGKKPIGDTCCDSFPKSLKKAKRKTVEGKGEIGEGGSSDIYQ